MSGIIHTHEDGTTHEHFRAGFTIGGQVIEDDDGTGEHSHSTFDMVTGERGKSSGPVIGVNEDAQARSLGQFANM